MLHSPLKAVFRLSPNYRKDRFIEAAIFISRYRFLLSASAKLELKFSAEQAQAAKTGLKNYFLAHAHRAQLRTGGDLPNLAMPSAAAGSLWHEFILCTRDYAEFCERAFGAMLHHEPAQVGMAIAPEIRRSRDLQAFGKTYVATKAARDDCAGLAASAIGTFATISTLFPTDLNASEEFPFSFTEEELKHEVVRHTISSDAPRREAVCFGYCGDRVGGCGGGIGGYVVGLDGGSSGHSSGGDGGGGGGCSGGGGCGGGCGS